jgi:hypothetical protein
MPSRRVVVGELDDVVRHILLGTSARAEPGGAGLLGSIGYCSKIRRGLRTPYPLREP